MYKTNPSIARRLIFLLALLSFSSIFSQTTNYCASKSAAPWELWITNVRLGTIDATSGKYKDYATFGYSDYTNLSTILTKGQSYPLSVTPGLSWSGILPNAYCRVWIDFNNNNVFEDTEKVLEITNQNPFASSVTIPTTAATGATRMRVSVKERAYPGACEIFDQGEVEDYTIIVTDGTNNSCRSQDSLQLVSLYNATNGARWFNKWDLSKPMSTWFGVGLNAKGCVDTIVMPHNNLNGAIPDLNLPKLVYFILEGNPLSGTIPNFNFPKLTDIYLDFTQLSGTIPNFNFPELKTLQLNDNRLSGSIPNFNFPELTYFDLSINQLSGTIPNFNFPNLTDFYLFSNHLSGSIPNFNFPNLTALRIDANQLSGSIPNFNFPNLTLLTLSNNQLSGNIPNFNFPNLTYLRLNNNQLSGCIPLSLKSVCGKNVDISGNPNLSTQAFGAFCSANNTGACGSGNSCRFQDSLQLVSLYNATGGASWTIKWDLTKPINTWYGIILNSTGCVDSINLPFNKLNGAIPNLNMPNLRSLDLEHNLLNGAIPDFNLPNLQLLTLNDNQLSGCLPKSLKAFCGKNVTIYNNFGLATQNFFDFCNVNSGACPDSVLIFSIAATPIVYRQFQTLSFRITIKNTGTTTYSNVVITFPFPAKTVTAAAATPSTGTWQEYCAGGSHCYQWTIQTLAANATATLDVPVYVQDATGPIIATTHLLSAKPSVTISDATVTVNPVGNTNLIAQRPILDFEARSDFDKARLMWISNANNTDYFEILELDEQGVFQKIGAQKAASNEGAASYTFTDAALEEGSHYYLIKAVQLDGSFRNSAIREVKTNDWSEAQVFPNPAMDELSIVLKNFAGKQATMQIYNGFGRIVQTLSAENSGDGLLTTDVSGYPAGNYYIRIKAPGKRSVAARFAVFK